MSAFQPAAGANTSRPAGSNSPRPGVRPRGDERDGDGAGGSTTVSLHWTPALLASTTENATFTESEESVVDQLMRELALSNDVVSRRLRVLDNGGGCTVVPRSLAFHREVSLHHVGGLLASDQSTSFTMHRDGRSYEFHCDLRQLRSSGSVAMAARLAEMIGGTRAVLLTQCASGLGKDYDGRECQLVKVRIPSSLEWIRLIAPYMWPKQEFTLILRAVDEAGLFRGSRSSKEEIDSWVNARVKLVEACAKVKTEAGQQTHAELRAWRPYLDARGRIVRDDLAKTFGGFLDGDASAKADLSFSIAQSYEAFLDVISEDLNATFGTTFGVYPMPHTKVSVKQPFRALSHNRAGNRALARAVLRTGFPTCSEKFPALRAIANSSP